MKKVIAINGSPRRNGNTAELLQQALKGAQEAGAETELINLYSLNFKGCISCFYCKRKDKEHGTCAMKDDLSPVIERIKGADALLSWVEGGDKEVAIAGSAPSPVDVVVSIGVISVKDKAVSSSRCEA